MVIARCYYCSTIMLKASTAPNSHFCHAWLQVARGCCLVQGKVYIGLPV